MKKPRITDFDPDAKAPTLKSSLENMPVIEKPKAVNQPLAHAQTPAQNPLQNDEETPAKAISPQPSLPQTAKRSFVRRTFDFYEDQIAYLTRESLEARLAGKERSMNEMVREAIDDWISKRTTDK